MKVEREITIDATPSEVWEALSEPALMRDWLFEGGDDRPVELEEVEDEERLAFRWRREGQGETSVVFTLEAVPTGTRVVVVERGLRVPVEWAPALNALASVASMALA
ncbi:MAG: SRPBCC family protein [Thermoleophilaceae bacterium]